MRQRNVFLIKWLCKKDLSRMNNAALPCLVFFRGYLTTIHRLRFTSAKIKPPLGTA
jgi:hypothetical protein